MKKYNREVERINLEEFFYKTTLSLLDKTGFILRENRIQGDLVLNIKRKNFYENYKRCQANVSLSGFTDNVCVNLDLSDVYEIIDYDFKNSNKKFFNLTPIIDALIKSRLVSPERMEDFNYLILLRAMHNNIVKEEANYTLLRDGFYLDGSDLVFTELFISKKELLEMVKVVESEFARVIEKKEDFLKKEIQVDTNKRELKKVQRELRQSKIKLHEEASKSFFRKEKDKIQKLNEKIVSHEDLESYLEIKEKETQKELAEAKELFEKTLRENRFINNYVTDSYRVKRRIY